MVVEGVTTTALLDTGSTVSTVSRQFYSEHLCHKPIQSLNSIMNIECADGNSLPYDGFVEMNIDSFDGDEEDCSVLNGVFLVVPDSNYNSKVPILIGTNILSVMMDRTKDRHGDRFLQLAKLRTPTYMAFRSMLLRKRQLARRDGSLAFVKSAVGARTTLLPNTKTVVEGYIDKALPYHPVCALTQSTA